jgi:hypothetical protein
LYSSHAKPIRGLAEILSAVSDEEEPLSCVFPFAAFFVFSR